MFVTKFCATCGLLEEMVGALGAKGICKSCVEYSFELDDQDNIDLNPVMGVEHPGVDYGKRS